ncbi:MAG TPA: hypothetical protein VF669_21025 [Tepidisphaeraceae bacterium]|jgi:hypothetical protein
MKRLIAVALISMSTFSMAQDQEDLAPGAPHAAPSAHAAVEAPTYAHPALPAAHTTWPFPIMMMVAVMFVSAACIGWYIRMEMPEELPPTHSHDEPPGASHRHGHGGTVNPAPDGAPDHHA